MSYEHDIFISYRRECPTSIWMRTVFVPQLVTFLKPNRPNGLSIFDDDQIRIGSTWPNVLQEKIAASRLLLPMLTPFYFGSEWCRRELALMMAREEKLGLRNIGGTNQGLVIPIRLWDGDKYPDRLRALVQLGDFRGYSNARRGTRKWLQFEDAMMALANAIDQTLDEVPDYDPEWLTLSADAIEPLLRIAPPRQTTLLRITGSFTGSVGATNQEETL